MVEMKALLLLTLFASPAAAQTFSITLGGRELGALTYSAAGPNQSLQSTLDNTPLGVSDGIFSGTSRMVHSQSGALVRQYFGDDRGTRKHRVVTVVTDKHRVLATTVSPASEETSLSDATQVRDDVLDPVEAFGRFANAKDCPAAFRIYDGRRVGEVALTERQADAGTITCIMSYRVVAGPGHMSPLYIRSVTMTLTYAPDLRAIGMSTAMLRLMITR